MMNKTAAFALVFFGFAALLPAWGGKETAAPQEPVETPVRVRGRVRLVGSGPFPELVITGETAEWRIVREEQFKLEHLQQRVVTVEGLETVTELTFANGRSAGKRRTLKDVRIIRVE